MIKIRERQRGFTLVEILIVVVIIAILAALILPRIISQPERAYLAESQQMLGAIRRAEARFMDMTGATAYLDVQAAGDCTRLAIDCPAGTSWSYACAGTTCTATRLGTGPYAGAQISLSDAGNFNCTVAAGATNSYQAMTDPTQGCTIT